MSEFADLAEVFVNSHPEEAAALLETLPIKDITQYVQSLSPISAATLLNKMLPTIGGICLSHLPTETGADILKELSVDSGAMIIRTLKIAQQEELLEHLSEDKAQPLKALLRFPPNTAGALMDPMISSWPDDMEVRFTLKKMQSVTHRVVAYFYIVDRDKKLIGVLSYWELIKANPKARLESIMHPHVQRLKANAPKQSIISHPGWQNFHALPVIDDEGRFLGALRFKTMKKLEGEILLEAKHPFKTLLSFSELYWSGMSAVGNVLSTVALGHSNQNSKK